jgi:hypothetical protein
VGSLARSSGAAALAITLCACGANQARPTPSTNGDGGVFPTVLGCNPEFHYSYIVDDFVVLPSQEGFDLNGDGKIDNAFGPVSGILTPWYQHQIQDGSETLLFDFSWPPPPLTAGQFPGAAFMGIDAQTYSPETARYDGNGTFYVPNEQFDVRCRPSSRLMTDVLADGTVTAIVPYFSVVMQGVGTLEYHNAMVRAKLATQDYSEMSCDIGIVQTACSLSQTALSAYEGLSALDMVVGVFQIQPDIDSDGDGPDQLLINQNGNVVECVSGAGVHIKGTSCACDPRIADGYSQAYHWHGVPAKIIGTRE